MNDHSVELRDSESNKRARTDFGTEASEVSSSVAHRDYDDAVSCTLINHDSWRHWRFNVYCCSDKICHNFLNLTCQDATDVMTYYLRYWWNVVHFHAYILLKLSKSYCSVDRSVSSLDSFSYPITLSIHQKVHLYASTSNISVSDSFALYLTVSIQSIYSDRLHRIMLTAIARKLTATKVAKMTPFLTRLWALLRREAFRFMKKILQ